jgi:predicted nucleotidyltransferase
MNRPPSGRFVLRLPVKLHDARRRASAMISSTSCVCAPSGVPAGRPAAGEPGPLWLRAARRALGGELLGAVLFGSEARGEARTGSDIDLLLVAGPSVPLTRRLYALWDEKLGEDRHSPHFVHLPSSTADAGSLWLEAAVDGTVLYDREGRVGRFLGRLRRAIAAGRLTRKTAYGHPYWVKSEGGPAHDQ